MRIDFYALRAHENSYLLDLIKRLPQELYPEESNASLLIMPNMLMSGALAKYEQIYEKS